MRLSRPLARGSAAALLLVALLLVAGLVFNLDNLGPEGDEVPTIPGAASDRDDLSALLGLVPLVPLAVGVAVLLVFLGQPSSRGGVGRRERFRIQRPSLGTILLITTVLVPFIAFQIITFVPRGFGRFAGTGGGGGTSPTSAEFLIRGVFNVFERAAELTPGVALVTPLIEVLASDPLPVVPLAAVAVVEGVLASVILLRRGARRKGPRTDLVLAEESPAPTEERVPSDVLAAASLGDVRSTVLRCFGDFCEIVRRSGVAYREALSPREVEEIAVGRLGVPAHAAEGLTSLFEEARYSVHPLADDARRRAKDHLDRIAAVTRTRRTSRRSDAQAASASG